MWVRATFACLVLLTLTCSCAKDDNPGAALAQSTGCAACHGAAGEGGVGPKWKGLYGSTVKLSDGTTVQADRAYLKRSIVAPSAQKVRGYSVTMPHFHLSSHEVSILVNYIVSLR